jgi:hypothetical protein
VTHRDSGRTQRIDQRVVAELGGPQGGSADAFQGWLVLSREVELPPGVAQARIVVRDEFLGRMGALRLRFESPAGEGFFIATPLLLTDRLAGKAGGPMRPALVAHRDFPPGALYCQFEVFGAAGASGAARVVASWELRRRGGEVVRRGEPGALTPLAEGRHLGLLAVDLRDVAPGDHELVVTVRDEATGQVRERAEALRVTSAGAPLRMGLGQGG